MHYDFSFPKNVLNWNKVWIAIDLRLEGLFYTNKCQSNRIRILQGSMTNWNARNNLQSSKNILKQHEIWTAYVLYDIFAVHIWYMHYVILLHYIIYCLRPLKKLISLKQILVFFFLHIVQYTTYFMKNGTSRNAVSIKSVPLTNYVKKLFLRENN